MNFLEHRAARKRVRGEVTRGRADSDGLFAQAVLHHQCGQLSESEAFCRTILNHDSQHVASLHLLGTIAQQRGVHAEAAVLFRSLVRIKPEIADGHFRLGLALIEMGRVDEAIQSIERARAIDANPNTRRRPEETPDYAWNYFNLANLYVHRRQFEKAAVLFQRSLALNSDVAEVHNGFGALLVTQGRLAAASAEFACALALAPELLNTYADLRATLFAVSPATKDAVTRATASWPRRLSMEELLGTDSLSALLDPLLLSMLECGPVYDVELERMLTSLRAALLKAAVSETRAVEDTVMLRIACSLAQQCFSNEYIFLPTTEEHAQAELLHEQTAIALRASTAVSPLQLAAVACYFPLDTLADSGRLLDHVWPDPLAGVLTRQVCEVQQERELRNTIPRLTAIEDAISVKVRKQYEENPYPRWIKLGTRPRALTIRGYFHQKFPDLALLPINEQASLDVLVAGCGTGRNPIGMAQTFHDARVLAIDLSLASLSYSLRKTREMGLQNIEFAQADLMQLGLIDRTFDVIDASGVLHHLTDPIAGWRVLLALLRPQGIMGIGLYSELGRREIVAAQRYADAYNYRATTDDIRRCRQDLLDHGYSDVAKAHDFFSISGSRDLLFHVREHRHTLPQIKEFLALHGLRFIGFELAAPVQSAYRSRFPDDPPMTDLDRWHTFETEQPGTFAAMYQFWCQRN